MKTSENTKGFKELNIITSSKHTKGFFVLIAAIMIAFVAYFTIRIVSTGLVATNLANELSKRAHEIAMSRAKGDDGKFFEFSGGKIRECTEDVSMDMLVNVGVIEHIGMLSGLFPGKELDLDEEATEIAKKCVGAFILDSDSYDEFLLRSNAFNRE